MHTLLALLLLSYAFGNIHCSTSPRNTTDIISLLDFKHAITNDPSGVLNNWNTSTPFCQWAGVKCSRRTPEDCVVLLNLGGQSLTGTLTTSLGNLTFLRTLNLSVNNLSGQLPDLSHLRNLEVLDLSSNSLQGVIPDTLTNCSNLRKLVLSYNFLEGEIPLNVGHLSKLSSLHLASNNLTGAIPSTLNNTELQKITIADKKLTGSIPDELGYLSNMSVLLLGDNMLSGGFPSALLNIPSLEMLDLGGNMLHGTILPSNIIGYALPNLGVLVLSVNEFEGQLPASFGNVSSLEVIDLSSNKFSGQTPSSFGSLLKLSYLNLENNMLEASDDQGLEFLHALKNCTLLNSFSLGRNRLSGSIPNYIGELSTELEYLILSSNELSGVVPSRIGNLTGLATLGLDNNSLTGPIGEWVGMLKDLQDLELQQNNFDGPIPASIGNLTKLLHPHLEHNKFTGTIPASLAYLQQLLTLDLSNNSLHGIIPTEVFRLPSLVTCVLSYNNLTGPMPSEVHLIQLTELRLLGNNFFGEIPANLSECQELNIIELDQNILTGSIPLSLGNLATLNILNLSHNNFSGFIPTTLSGLELLTHLDLSYNHLQGEIPMNGVFTNATAVSLNGNWGLCGGVKDLHMPTCPAVSRSIELKLYLTILLILIFDFVSFLMTVYVILLMKKKSRRPYIILLSFGKKFPRVSCKDLAQATGNFSESNLIGRGSYGSVYRGKLTQAKVQVAIKVFDLGIKFADRSFVSECEALGIIWHRNLLPILTSCSTIDNRGNDFKALIYEFMHNGSLDTWLHQKHCGVSPKLLGLAQRISIAIDIANALVDIANALVYLHHDCERPIVHCDLKPTNILLDDNMNACIGDFGIANLLGYSSSSCSLAVTGAVGYIPSEYAQSVHASTSGDVYSFGIVLLVMLIGKRPTDSMFEGELNIVRFVERKFPDQMLCIIDACLQEECKGFIQAMVGTENEAHRCFLSLVQVAISCTCLLPRERMDMREVAAYLHSIRRSYVAAMKQEQVMLC